VPRSRTAGRGLTEDHELIRRATPDANLATARELSAAEREDVATRAAHYLDTFDYQTLRRQL
jgi:hypothetical protein